MKRRNIFAVKGKVILGALGLSLSNVPVFAAESDAHAFVRASILNTWTPTAVGSPTEGKLDAHERARITVVGAPRSPGAAGIASASTASGLDAHDQARRLLLAQPVVSRNPVVAVDGNRPGS
jgi:hypothetical protein